jgi:hypothetical protein
VSRKRIATSYNTRQVQSASIDSFGCVSAFEKSSRKQITIRTVDIDDHDVDTSGTNIRTDEPSLSQAFSLTSLPSLASYLCTLLLLQTSFQTVMAIDNCCCPDKGYAMNAFPIGDRYFKSHECKRRICVTFFLWSKGCKQQKVWAIGGTNVLIDKKRVHERGVILLASLRADDSLRPRGYRALSSPRQRV